MYRELAFQISEQVEALGGGMGVRSAVVVGGVDMMEQALVLAKKPHVVIGKSQCSVLNQDIGTICASSYSREVSGSLRKYQRFQLA